MELTVKTLLFWILLMGALPVLAGCAVGQSLPASVTGNVTYLQRIALPDDAVVTVQLQDVSLADAPATVLGEQVIQTEGKQVPFAYSVPYDPQQIQDNHSYGMRATIADGAGNLLFTSTTAYPVITQGNPTSNVEIVVQQVAPSAPATSELTGVVWLWQGTTDAAGQTTTPDDPNKYTLEFLPEGRVNVVADCNSGSGPYTVEGASLSIGPLATTLVACPPGSLSDTYLIQLQNAGTYVTADSNLIINQKADSGDMTFSPQSADLAGTNWIVTGYNNGKQAVVSPILGTELTAAFGADGSLSGSAGCNNYTASYQVDGSSITIGPAATTRKACAQPEGIMEQEQQYLTALSSAATHRLVGNKLELRTADGALAVTYVKP
jgi:uncharacterized lipoprotein YbaY